MFATVWGLERENLRRLFFECPVISNIWMQNLIVQGPQTDELHRVERLALHQLTTYQTLQHKLGVISKVF